jgi:hypothetical protein
MSNRIGQSGAMNRLDDCGCVRLGTRLPERFEIAT